ncbi:MAG: 50S ribosomal protein L17 [bacterium]
MRHRLKDNKLGRTMAHRKALVSALVCALIEQRRIKTTLQKARAARSLAEKMVTLAKQAGTDASGKLNAWRRIESILRRRSMVHSLFDQVLPACSERTGGYTRIVKLDRRRSDGAEMVILEWVSLAPVEKKTKKTPEQTDQTQKKD